MCRGALHSPVVTTYNVVCPSVPARGDRVAGETGRLCGGARFSRKSSFFVAKGRALVTDSYRRLPHTIYTRQLCADRKLSIRRDPITHLTISQLRTQPRFGKRHAHALAAVRLLILAR